MAGPTAITLINAGHIRSSSQPSRESTSHSFEHCIRARPKSRRDPTTSPSVVSSSQVSFRLALDISRQQAAPLVDPSVVSLRLTSAVSKRVSGPGGGSDASRGALPTPEEAHGRAWEPHRLPELALHVSPIIVRDEPRVVAEEDERRWAVGGLRGVVDSPPALAAPAK